MKTTILAAALCAVAVPAAAQETATFVAVGGPEHSLAGSLVGQPLVSSDGIRVGTVENLLVSPRGRVDAVVVGTGRRAVALDFADVEAGVAGAGGPALVSRASAAQIGAAPSFRAFRDAPEAATAVRVELPAR